MNRKLRIYLLVAASLTTSVASIPATGVRGVLFGIAGAAFGLAALASLRSGGAR